MEGLSLEAIGSMVSASARTPSRKSAAWAVVRIAVDNRRAPTMTLLRRAAGAKIVDMGWCSPLVPRSGEDDCPELSWPARAGAASSQVMLSNFNANAMAGQNVLSTV